MPLGVYKPGDGILHRLRPGAKLLGLFAFATAVIWARGPLTASIALGISLALALLAGLRGLDLLRIARGFAIVAALLFAFQLWQKGWAHAYEVVGDLHALILAASAFTACTQVDDLLDTIVWALTPLRPLGVRPERVALAFSLVLGAIPFLFGLARETQAAARARGLEREPRATLVPFTLRTIAHAQNVGDALQARGIGDEE